MEDTNPLQSQKQKNKRNKIRNKHREKNQNKLYLDQVGDYIQKNIESDSNHVSIKEGQWSTWPCSGYGKSRQWCVLRKWDGSVHRRKVESN